VHGFPRVMGVLTHLDGFRNDDKLKKVKKALKHRFWTEIYQGERPTSSEWSSASEPR
jgi:ribosome biogenesis protein BMS1